MYKLEGGKVFKIFSPFLFNYAGRYWRQVYFCLLNQLRLSPVPQSTGMDAGPAPDRKLEVQGWWGEGEGHTHRGTLAHPE